MGNNRQTPFVPENQWRFTEGKQPERGMTIKKLQKELVSLLSAPLSSILEVENDENRPVALRNAARSLRLGETSKIIELINMIEDAKIRRKTKESD